jgi:uncharacterized damage-inducible protein DinB
MAETDWLVTPKEQFLNAYENEHAITMRVLRAYPEERLDLQPHPKLRTAREIAWVLFMERAFGTLVLNDGFASMDPNQIPPPPPESWSDQLAALETIHTQFAELVGSLSDDQLAEKVSFFPRMGSIRRIDFLWFMLSDQIHHRGQFSVYLRMADGRVPSIYGPTADEPVV